MAKKLLSISFYFLSVLGCFAQLIESPIRTWTRGDQTYEGKLEAKCVASPESKERGAQDEAQILMTNGSRLFIRLSELSAEDRAFVEEWSVRENSAKQKLYRSSKNHEQWHNLKTFFIALIIGFAIWRNRGLFDVQKLKAIYALWIFSHLLLLIFSPNPFDKNELSSPFYPFIFAQGCDLESGVFFDHTEVYDISEFFVYAFSPFVIWYSVRLWRANKS